MRIAEAARDHGPDVERARPVRELDRAPAAAVVRRVTRLDLVLPVDRAAEHDPRRVLVVERDARVVVAEQRPARLRDRLCAPAPPVPAAVAERCPSCRRATSTTTTGIPLRSCAMSIGQARPPAGRVRLDAVERRLVYVGHHDLHAEIGAAFGRRKADAARGAGDDGRAAFAQSWMLRHDGSFRRCMRGKWKSHSGDDCAIRGILWNSACGAPIFQSRTGECL